METTEQTKIAPVDASENASSAHTSLPTHSTGKAATFTILVAFAVVINIACGIVSYAIYSRGAILEDLYDYLVSNDLEFFVWAAAVAGLLGAIVTLVAYILSFDFRRPKRPLARLWILLTSFAMSLVGLLLGMLDIDPDNVPVVLGALVVSFIFPWPILAIEKAAGKGALRSARKFLRSNSPSSARASARTALTLRPGNPDALTVYGLAAAAAGRHAQALPFLIFAEEHEPEPDPATTAALADAWEAVGNQEKTIEYLDKLPPDQAAPELLDRQVRLWLDTGRDERAREAIREMPTDQRRPWRDDYQRLLILKSDRRALHNLCDEFRADDEAPFEKTIQCLKEILTLYPSDTQALQSLITLQKELKQRDTVAALQEELIAIDEDRIDIRRELMEYYWERGNRVELLRHLNRIMLSGQATTDEKIRFLEENYTEGDYLTIEQLVAQEEDLTLNARALSILANALHQGERNEEAIERIAQARRLGPDEKLAQNLDALAAKIKKTVLTSELSDLEQRAATTPADLDLKFDYLDRLVASRATDRVVVHLDDLLEAQPDLQDRVENEIRMMLQRHGKNRRLMEYLGDLYLRRNDYDKAFEIYERRAQGEMDSAENLHSAAQYILSKNPDHVPSLLSEMRYYHDTGDPAAALAHFDRLQTIGTQPDTDMRALEMHAAEQAGDAQRAIRAGEALLSEKSDAPELLSHVARLAVETGDFPKAIAHLEKAVELDPDSFDWRRQLRSAVETMKKNRMEEIRAQLAQQPANRELLEELGDLHHDFEKFNDAIASYQRAGMNDPDRRIPKAKQGYVLARKGLFTDADEVLQEADLRSDLPEEEQEKLKNLFYITGQLMEQEEEFDRALALYRRIFRVDAGYRDVVEHVERLQVTGKKKRRQENY